jgi:ABC-2 type transport system ATP-binding protein
VTGGSFFGPVKPGKLLDGGADVDDVIITESIAKSYGSVKAVDGVSLKVRKGEIYGFLGLNGAGKTTTIRMLLGMVRPTSGHAFINGKKVNAGNHDLWGGIGYLVEMPYSYPELTVRENLEIVKRLRNIAGKNAVDEVMEKLQLNIYADRKAKDLSLGNSQRLGIAKAVIHQPEILVLDEPSNGLDPAGIVEIRELLRDLAFNKGVTVFISSHILTEIARIATRIGIIHCGRLIQETDYASLDKMRDKKLAVAARDMQKTVAVLKENGYKIIAQESGSVEIHDGKAIEAPEAVSELLVRAGCPPVMLKVEEEDLESYFLRIIGMNGGVK